VVLTGGETAMEAKYNTRSPAVKRLMKEAAELSVATADYQAAPLEENLFEWHFTVRGPGETDFQGGVYHGRIIVPAEYPMKPPDIIILTPNGRFEVGKKICLSISGHHPETWQPSWSIRTALLAIIGFMPSPAQGTIGSLDYTPEERQDLARKSLSWRCPSCGQIASLLAPPGEEAPGQAQEVKEIVENLQINSEEELAAEKKKEEEGSVRVEPVSPLSLPGPPGASSTSPSSTPASTSPSTTTPTLTSAPPSGTRTRRAGTTSQTVEESRAVQNVYDFCIMLLVAAIAALIYRRIGIIQGPGDASNIAGQE